MKKLKQMIRYKLGDNKVEKLKKIFGITRVIMRFVSWIFIAMLTLAIIVFLITGISGEMPMFFGYTIQRIASESMEPELHTGDVIICKKVTDVSDISIGDIVTFQVQDSFKNQNITHRVLVAPYDDGNGDIVLVTKGDANNVDDGEISINDVKSKCLRKAGLLKGLYDFFFSPWGLVVFIILLLIVFFDEIMKLVRILIESKDQQQPESFIQIYKRLQREEQEKNKSNDVSEYSNNGFAKQANSSNEELALKGTEKKKTNEKTDIKSKKRKSASLQKQKKKKRIEKQRKKKKNKNSQIKKKNTDIYKKNNKKDIGKHYKQKNNRINYPNTNKKKKKTNNKKRDDS